MPETKNDLGCLVSLHTMTPAHIQRALIVVFLSFVFFLAMLAAFSLLRHFGYFLLAVSFLVVHLFTVIGLWVQKRSVVKIFERGISYKHFTGLWSDIAAFEEIADGKGAVTIKLTDQKRQSVTIPSSIANVGQISAFAREKVGNHAGHAEPINNAINIAY